MFGFDVSSLLPLSLILPFDVYWRVHARTPSPSCLNLISDLLHHFIHVPAGVVGKTQELAVLLLHWPAGAATLGHRFRLLILVSGFQLLNQPLFGWGGKKRHHCRRADDGIKVYPRPNLDGSLQAKQNERRCGEGESQLGREVG